MEQGDPGPSELITSGFVWALRVLGLALPVSILMGYLSYQQGIGWHNPSCSFAHLASCEWSWLHPLFWGPWPYRTLEFPTGAGLIPAIFWWLLVGLLVGVPLERLLQRRVFRKHVPRAN